MISLADAGIGYRHIAALGGRRGKPSVPSPNSFWENLSFRNYADYAMTESFRRGLTELRELARRQPTAMMCAEAVWWRCHRRIIADYLLVAGEQVIHLLGPRHSEPARLTPAAQLTECGRLLYSQASNANSAE